MDRRRIWRCNAQYFSEISSSRLDSSRVQSLPPSSAQQRSSASSDRNRILDGKLKFSGYVTFWLVLCAIYLGNLLLSFAITLLVYRFRDFYFEILGQFEELAYMEEYLRQLLSVIEAEPIRLIVVGALVAVQFGCVIWFLVSKRKLAFYILAAAAVLLSAAQLILGGGIGAVVYLIGPFTVWLLLHRSWNLLR